LSFLASEGQLAKLAIGFVNKLEEQNATVLHDA
jgi:hypothetical protein